MTETTSRSDWLELAIEAAHDAGKILRERFGGAIPYELKSSHHDLVTEADRLAEQAILQCIRRAYPDHGVLSEESPPQKLDAPYRWVIDPLDGTSNYAHGFPFFCVSIALEERGRLILGAVYDPVREEQFSALAGEGARLNGRPLQVSDATRLQESLLATSFPHDPQRRERNLRDLGAFLPLAQSVRRIGSAALCLAYVAAGRLDGYWDLDLHRWDLAAGHLLVGEAGGRVSNLAGRDLSYEGRELIASNGKIHSEMLHMLKVS
jgi:myo-inositol-1(or 4)-monophosphatase